VYDINVGVILTLVVGYWLRVYFRIRQRMVRGGCGEGVCVAYPCRFVACVRVGGEEPMRGGWGSRVDEEHMSCEGS